MAGFSSRTQQSEGKYQDLFVKVLAGEMCVDYALRLKHELGDATWVSGCCDDVSAYIPSARMIPESGYEVERWMAVGDLPTPFRPKIEDIIVGKAHELLQRGGNGLGG
jgi:hypothetical protein